MFFIYNGEILELLRGTEAPVMTPNGVDFSFLFLNLDQMADLYEKSWVSGTGIVLLPPLL